MQKELTWAEIDLGAIDHNVRELRRLTRPSARLLVAVKANAYGHGAVAVARQALASGADALGVARLQEGIELRAAGLAAPILIFGYTPPAVADRLLAFDLTQTVSSLEGARALSAAALAAGGRVRAHIKVDSGMGRLGLLLGDEASCATAVAEIQAIAALPGLQAEGLFTHFAASDSRDKASARAQFEVFRRLLDALGAAGKAFDMRHAANSGAIIEMPETHLDMVRAGIALYGLWPSEEVDRRRAALRPAMTLKTRIIHLKRVPAGFKVSYGGTYTTPAPTTIATVAIGYADGFSRQFSSNGRMLLRGRAVPIVGRVCMDLTMLDVGGVPEAALEDEVVVFGRQGDAAVTADELAARRGTINYEITSAITARVPRYYLGRPPGAG